MATFTVVQQSGPYYAICLCTDNFDRHALESCNKLNTFYTMFCQCYTLYCLRVACACHQPCTAHWHTALLNGHLVHFLHFLYDLGSSLRAVLTDICEASKLLKIKYGINVLFCVKEIASLFFLSVQVSRLTLHLTTPCPHHLSVSG